MHQFIVDVNLPIGVQPFNTTDFIHVSEMDCGLADAAIWDFAKERNCTIISKDADFYNRILLVSPPPRVIHIRFGNLKLFINLMTRLWPDILEMHREHKLVNVYNGWIEGIN